MKKVHNLQLCVNLGPSPEVIKLSSTFMLNSAENEMFHANNSQITNNGKFFLA